MTPEAVARQDHWRRLYLAERRRALNALRRNLLQRMREGPPVRADMKGADDIPEERIREGVTPGPALLQRWEKELREIRAGKVSAAVSEGYLVSPRERRVLDLKADMVARINLLQIANGLANYVPAEVGRAYDPNKPKADWLPFQILSETMLCDYSTLRFYAALSALQRDRLLKGQLSFASLDSSRKRMASFVLPELEEQDRKSLSRLRLGLYVGRSWVFITRSESYSTDQATELQLVISQALDGDGR